MLLSRLFDCWKSQILSQHRSNRRRLGLPFRPTATTESLECRALLATTILVINTSDSGAGSLRQAIEDANQSVDAARIEFAIPNTDAGFVDADNGLSVVGTDAAADVFRIQLQSALPHINNVNGQPVTLDASTQATLTGNTNPNGPEVVLDGDSLNVHGLFILSDFVAVRGFVIQNFGGNGVFVENANNVVIAGNYVGVDATGTLARPNSLGILIGGGDEVTIGGSQIGDRNHLRRMLIPVLPKVVRFGERTRSPRLTSPTASRRSALPLWGASVRESSRPPRMRMGTLRSSPPRRELISW